MSITQAKRTLISAFILLNILTATLTNTQGNWVPLSISSPLLVYGRWTRLLQRWSLFSPEPRRYTQSFHFEITFRDGTKKLWERPYPPLWDFFERHHAYHWQKLDTASNHFEDPHLWPDYAHWVQREFSNDRNPPTEIRLIRKAAEIDAPAQTGYIWHEPSELNFIEQTLFTYDVATQELQK